jgi:hypothetical protein
MRKIWQTEWFEIQFDTFISVDQKNIANEKFYEKFYEKFKSFEDLPQDYRKNKIDIANFIISSSKKYNKVMSIGCGNGIIESHIKKHSDKTILAIEPSNNSKWIKNTAGVEFISGFFPACVESENYEFGYCSSIDYVFNDEEYLDFLSKVYKYNFQEFYLLEVITPSNNLLRRVKNLLIMIGLYTPKGQFWGYLRTIDEHLIILKQAGFKNIKHGKHKHESYWIKIENE